MSIRTTAEFEGIRRVGRVVALALARMAASIRAGVTTAELDGIGAGVLEHHGARSAPQLCVGFPAATCISVNDEAAHGIPGARALVVGDLVNLDVSAELDGFFADTGASFPVEPVSNASRDLCRHGRRALRKAVAVMKPGVPMNRTGQMVEREARRGGLQAIRNLCAHGVGRWLHEAPLEIQNVYDPCDHRRFSDGLVVAMETFLAQGTAQVIPATDGWTLKTADGSRAAQYEHTVVVTGRGPLVVTTV